MKDNSKKLFPFEDRMSIPSSFEIIEDKRRVRGHHAGFMIIDDFDYKMTWYKRIIRFLLGGKNEVEQIKKKYKH